MGSGETMETNKRGFTLIEIVIVIAVLGILAGIAIPRFMDSRATAAGSKLLADLRTIDSASSIYQAKKGTTPTLEMLVQESFLADNVVPPYGTMLVVNKDGNSVEYKSVATKYTLNEEGRATYTSDRLTNGTVEQYLAYGNGVTSYNEIVKLAQEAIASGSKGGGNINNHIGLDKFPPVEASLLQSLFGNSYEKNLQWRVNSNWSNSNVVYFATGDTEKSNGRWQAVLVVVNGTLYKAPNGDSISIANGVVDASDVSGALAKLGFEQVGPINGF